MKNTEIKKGTILYANTGVAVKVLEYSSKFGGRVLVERADGIEGGKPMWKPLEKFSETNPHPTKENGGSLVEPYFRFTKNDYNKLIGSGKFEAVRNGNILEIKAVDSSKKLGKYREEKEVIFIFGKKDLSNPLVVWLKENSFIPSSQIEKLAKGSRINSNIEKMIKNIAVKHNGTINYILDKKDGSMSLDFNFPTPEDKQNFVNEMQEMNNATVRFSKGGNTPKSFEYSIGGL